MTEQKMLEGLHRRFGQHTMNKIISESDVQEFSPNTVVLREGQYVKAVPIVLKGLINVHAGDSAKEILLYYIQPEESCIMSFSACLQNRKSRVTAIVKEDTTAILIPADKLPLWLLEFPELNQLFFQQFDLRYTAMIDTIHNLLFDKLEKRLLDYLRDKIAITRRNPIRISHKEIAADLGTAREVVSRLIKKLEHLEKLKQHYDSIELF